MELENITYFVKRHISCHMNIINSSEIQKHWPTIYLSSSHHCSCCHKSTKLPEIQSLENLPFSPRNVFNRAFAESEWCLFIAIPRQRIIRSMETCWCHWVFWSSWPVTRIKVLLMIFQELMNTQPFTQMPSWCKSNFDQIFHLSMCLGRRRLLGHVWNIGTRKNVGTREFSLPNWALQDSGAECNDL